MTVLPTRRRSSLVPLLSIVFAMALLAACADGEPDEVAAVEQATPEPSAAEPSAAEPTPPPTATAVPTPPPTEAAPTPAPTPSAGLSAGPTFELEPLLWEPCGDGDCAELAVPLDHDDPTGATIRLQIALVPARDADQRIGALLVNFGGPGASATKYLNSYHSTLPPQVRDRFDIVVWDPRGTDGQTVLDCPDSPLAGQLYDDDDGFADDVELEDERRIDYAQCSAVEGLLDNLGSVPTVHDMDLIRRALGEDKLNYLGYSYGTQLGWMYATLYGDNIRSIVLDAPVEPGMHSAEGWLRQMENFDAQIARLDELCDDFATRCPVAGEGLLEVVERLTVELADQPVIGADGRPFTDADLVSASLQTLYSQPSLIGDFFSNGLARLDQGQPDLLVQLTDSDGFDGYNAITCADGEGINSLDELEDHIVARYERGGTFEAYPDVVLCDEWPARAIPLPEIDTSSAPPALVIANTDDPATPYVGALQLVAALGNAGLVTVQSGGHGAVAGNGCVDELFATYVIDLELPPAGMRCYEDGRRLGVGTALGESGLEVVRVDTGSYGEAAGLLVGDQIVSVDDTDLRAGGNIPFFELGTDVTLVVLRGGQEVQLTLTTLRAPWTS